MPLHVWVRLQSPQRTLLTKSLRLPFPPMSVGACLHQRRLSRFRAFGGLFAGPTAMMPHCSLVLDISRHSCPKSGHL